MNIVEALKERLISINYEDRRMCWDDGYQAWEVYGTRFRNLHTVYTLLIKTESEEEAVAVLTGED